MKLKNKSLMLLLSFSLIGSTFFNNVIPIYASEITVENITEEENNEEKLNNEVENTEETGIGDGYEPITVTQKDETNTVQMSFLCKMPKYFTLGVRMQILNLDTNEIYEITATKANNYYGKLYIPAGSYTVASVMVDGDVTNKYPMVYPEDFTVYDGSNHSIETTLVNYDEIQKEAYERMGLDEEGNKKIDKDGYDETTEVKDILFDGNVLPWRVVNRIGTGNGIVTISGTAKGVYDIILEITTSGLGRSAEYKYSTDGGETWSDVRIVSGTEVIDTRTNETTGLKLNFDSNMEYIKGDTYSYKSAYEFEASVENNLNGGGTIRLYSENGIYDQNHQIRVTITQTGKMSEARFKYNLDGKISEDILIPEDGNFQIPGTELLITFWDNGDKFVVGDSWYSEIKGLKGIRDYTPFYIGGGVILIVGILGVFFYFGNLKDKPINYKLMPYKKVNIPMNENAVKKDGKKKK